MTDKRDILSEIAQDARHLRRARMLPTDRRLTPEEINQVARDYKAWLKQTRRSNARVSKALGDGFSETTLSQFSNALFKGDCEKVARGLNEYMERETRTSEVQRPAGWVTTEAANRMLAVIRAAVNGLGMGLITGPAGVGKTMVLTAANKEYTGSILIRVMQSERRCTGLVSSIARILGVPARSTIAITHRLVVEALRGSNKPIFIDEAHKLKHDALEALRDIHDEAGVPIILCGTIDVKKSVQDTDANFGQFSSRIISRVDVAESVLTPRFGPKGRGQEDVPTLFSVEEVQQLFAAGQLRISDQAIDLLTDVANALGHGCLRLVVKMVQIASMNPKVLAKKEIDRGVLLAVLRQMHGEAYAELVVERSRQLGGMRIAASA